MTGPVRRLGGVSFVVPVHNGARWIRATLQSIVDQECPTPFEIIVVDDHSEDDSCEVVGEFARDNHELRVISSETRGAASAINTGFRAAQYAVVCQIDQDVVLMPGWLEHLTLALEDERVGAAQGYYETDRKAPLLAGVMGFDLEQRYASIENGETDHVCTGNAAYRAEALARAGYLDETMGYGYDNDLSYRLLNLGYRLKLSRDARSTHQWREGLRGYLLQQYGFGYGRLDVVARHRSRVTGDAVSRVVMMAHPLLTMVALSGFAAWAAASIAGGSARTLALLSVGILLALAAERAFAGVAAAVRFHNLTPLVFPFAHLMRDLAWVAAIVVWSARRLFLQAALPHHSMRPGARRATETPVDSAGMRRVALLDPPRSLCVIPVHNEAVSLPAVVAEIQEQCPALDIVVVDDGSTDETPAVVAALGVGSIRLRERLGVGSAMKAGLRYAFRTGYSSVVRVDGDGQHRAADAEQLLHLVTAGRADAVLGSRYTGTSRQRDLKWLFRTLLAWVLSAQTGRRITDPTCGLCAFGRRAICLLADHHPTGYPEPELLLLLKWAGLQTLEHPIEHRSRFGGQTSLTLPRVVTAVARVLLAMVIVPLRRPIGESAGD